MLLLLSTSLLTLPLCFPNSLLSTCCGAQAGEKSSAQILLSDMYTFHYFSRYLPFWGLLLLIFNLLVFIDNFEIIYSLKNMRAHF